MPEGSPADPTPPAPEDPASPPADDDAQPEGMTVEQVEAIWKNRVSQKDRAHAAEAQALRNQNETMRQTLARYEAERQQQQSGDQSEADRWKARAEELERSVETERQQRIIDTRKAKYAAAAEALDDTVLATMDEGKLAALNARLADEDAPPRTSGPVDPNAAPRRTPAPPPSPAERTVADLQSDLKKYEPEFKERVANT